MDKKGNNEMTEDQFTHLVELLSKQSEATNSLKDSVATLLKLLNEIENDVAEIKSDLVEIKNREWVFKWIPKAK